MLTCFHLSFIDVRKRNGAVRSGIPWSFSATLACIFCSSFKFPLSQKLTIRSSISVRNIELLFNFCQVAKSLWKLTTNCRGEWLNLRPPGPASVARRRVSGTGGYRGGGWGGRGRADGRNGNWTAHNHVQVPFPWECLVALACCSKEPALIFLGEGSRHPNISAMPTPRACGALLIPCPSKLISMTT